MFYKGKSKYVLSSTFTEQGLISCLPDLVVGLRRVYILKGAAGTGKSTFIRLTGEALSERGYEVEYWISAADAFNPEGIYIPQLDTAVVNGSGAAALEPRYPNVTGYLLYLGDYLEQDAIKQQAMQIIGHIERREEKHKEAVLHLQAAARAHAIIKRGNASHLNLQKLYSLADELYCAATKPLPLEKHYFASAMTASGYINYVGEISADCRQRFILTGPTGSGKSTILAEIAGKALAQGHSVEYFHSGLEAESLLMIILPAFSTAVIDAGGLQLDAKAGDKVISMEAILDDFDSAQAMAIYSSVERDYETLLGKAQEELEQARQELKALKRLYASKMDFQALDKQRLQLLAEILTD